MTFLALSVIPAISPAETVCQVHDGDSIRVLQGGGCTRRIRFAGIDAPELRQPMGKASRDYLSTLIQGKSVALQCKGQSYRRDVCRISVGGQDVQAAMVAAGWAYDYAKYSGGAYQPQEAQARAHRRGVWSQPGQVAPWVWRHRQ